MQNTFPRGIHPAHNKSLTDKKNIEFMPPPATVYIPLSQHIGKSAKCIVNVGDRVTEGQKIGEADGFVGAPVFSSVSGVVKNIEMRPTLLASAEHVVIERDESISGVFRFEPLADKSREKLLERIKEAGIVGMGGAGFPTHVKLSPKEKIDTFIINAAEAYNFLHNTVPHRKSDGPPYKSCPDMQQCGKRRRCRCHIHSLRHSG